MNLEDAREVIRWYQHFIDVKLLRAVRGELDEREKEFIAHDSSLRFPGLMIFNAWRLRESL